jgi:hypothetical protein
VIGEGIGERWKEDDWREVGERIIGEGESDWREVIGKRGGDWRGDGERY